MLDSIDIEDMCRDCRLQDQFYRLINQLIIFFFQSVGCDMMLDSNAVEDMCRDCGGDNSTCRLFENRFTRRRLPEGMYIPGAAYTNQFIINF